MPTLVAVGEHDKLEFCDAAELFGRNCAPRARSPSPVGAPGAARDSRSVPPAAPRSSPSRRVSLARGGGALLRGGPPFRVGGGATRTVSETPALDDHRSPRYGWRMLASLREAMVRLAPPNVWSSSRLLARRAAGKDASREMVVVAIWAAPASQVAHRIEDRSCHLLSRTSTGRHYLQSAADATSEFRESFLETVGASSCSSPPYGSPTAEPDPWIAIDLPLHEVPRGNLRRRRTRTRCQSCRTAGALGSGT
jgi:hypothetical protein